MDSASLGDLRAGRGVSFAAAAARATGFRDETKGDEAGKVAEEREDVVEEEELLSLRGVAAERAALIGVGASSLGTGNDCSGADESDKLPISGCSHVSESLASADSSASWRT